MMKKYTELRLEICDFFDVITTSVEVTTPGVSFPWSEMEKNDASYQLVKVSFLKTADVYSYDL